MEDYKRCPHCNIIIKSKEDTCDECAYIDNVKLAMANARIWMDHLEANKNNLKIIEKKA